MRNRWCLYCGQHLDTGFNCPNSCTPSKISKPHTCPVCNGSTKVQKPPYVPGDQDTWVSGGTELYPCQACNGSGIVWEKL